MLKRRWSCYALCGQDVVKRKKEGEKEGEDDEKGKGKKEKAGKGMEDILGRNNWEMTRSGWIRLMGMKEFREAEVLKVWTDGGNHFKSTPAIHAVGEVQGLTMEELAQELEAMHTADAQAAAVQVREDMAQGKGTYQGLGRMPLMSVNFFAAYHG